MAKENTREKIVKTALRLFSIYGYSNTTTKLIAKEAGVNEVTIFRYFGNKDNLFQESTKDYVEELNFVDRVNKIYELDFEEVVLKVGLEYLSYCFDNEYIYKIQLKMQDNIEGFEKLKLSKNYIKGFEIYLTSLQNEGKLKAGEPNVLANSFILSILGIFTYYVLENDCTKEYVYDNVKQHIDIFVAYQNK